MPSVLQHVCQWARRPPGTDDGAKRHVAVSSTKTGSRRDVRAIDNVAPSMSLRPYIRPGHRGARAMWRALSIRMTSLMPLARTRLCVAIATRSVRGSAPRVIVESFDDTVDRLRFDSNVAVRSGKTPGGDRGAGADIGVCSERTSLSSDMTGPGWRFVAFSAHIATFCSTRSCECAGGAVASSFRRHENAGTRSDVCFVAYGVFTANTARRETVVQKYVS